jgi:hypothetical protein
MIARNVDKQDKEYFKQAADTMECYLHGNGKYDDAK